MIRSSASQPSAATTATEQLVRRLFERWRDDHIPFVVLRNYERLPHAVGNDLDVLVPVRFHRRAERNLLEVAESLGFSLVNRIERCPVSIYLWQREAHCSLQIDLFSAVRWKAFDILPAIEVIRRSEYRHGYRIPHPVDEALLCLLGTLLQHGTVRVKYQSRIASIFAAHRDVAAVRLRAVVGSRLGARVLEHTGSRAWPAIEAMAGRLRAALVRRRTLRSPLRTLDHIGSEVRRLARRAATLPGVTVVLLGPDGCGKSTLSRAIVDRGVWPFAAAQSKVVHWKPRVFQRLRQDTPVTTPHGRPPRGSVTSTIFLTLHSCHFLIGYLMAIWPSLYCNGIVVIERYYHDVLVDPLRYRLPTRPRLIRLLKRLIPQPDLVIYLDAPLALLLRRKQELPATTLQRLQHGYRRLVRELPQGRTVDASQTIDDLVVSVAGLTYERLVQRQARRRSPAHNGTRP